MKAKTIYIQDDLLNRVMENSSSKKFSNRVQDLLEKGLLYESKGDEMGVRESILALVKAYNKRTNKPIINLN